MEQNDFYPFGGRLADSALSQQSSPFANRWRFSGKEDLSVALGDPVLDFGARMYSTTGAMWQTQDPLAEKHVDKTPYIYCNNTPILFIDPNGMDWYRNTTTGEIIWEAGYKEIENYENIGPSFEEQGIYYSLFGAKVPEYDKEGNPIGALYKAIDRFITNYNKSNYYIPNSQIRDGLVVTGLSVNLETELAIHYK